MRKQELNHQMLNLKKDINDNIKDENDGDIEMNGNGDNINSNGIRMKLNKSAAKRFIGNNMDKDMRNKGYQEFGDEMTQKWQLRQLTNLKMLNYKLFCSK